MKSQWKKNSSKISKVNIDEETALSTWMNTAVKGNISQKINTQLKELNLSQCGDIDFFLGCIHKEMKRVLGEEYTCVDIEAYINDQVECSSVLKSIMFVINEFEVNLKMISLNKDFKNFHYGERFSRKILLLHIGFKYFMPLSHGNVMDYEINEKDKKILENIYSEPQIICDGDIKAEKKLLKSLRKMLQGSECAQIIPDIPKRLDKKKAYYDLRLSKDLEADKDLKLCMFHMKNAHFATASIIVNGGKKEKDISLLNRKCCGYNTFEGDTVYVEINDPKSWTGKVVGVQNSNHKPINSLYICKICRDQGSLMIPLDGTFPKIHIDNEPGRRKYEKDMKNKRVKGGNCFKDEQKSNQMKMRENSRFADNIYVTVYEVNYEEKTKKVIFLNPRIVKIDPETCSKLFIVCYQYWDISMMYPSGRVVGVMSTYNCFQDTLHLLLPLCKVESLDLNRNYINEIKKIKRSVNENQFLPRDIVPAGAMVFTIDNEDTQDMDDALSYHIEDQCTVVGVHITDITKYITPESEIYQQAKRKFSTSYMPKVLGKEPFYLLEKVLSTDIFSLVPNKSRAVLSVMFHFIKDDHRIQKVTFEETNIESKYKLNYKQVEQWIKEEERPSDVEEDLFIAIKECFKIAKQIRHSRLPDSYFVRQSNYCNPSFKFDDTFYANILIEEFMIMANEHVAKKIYEKYPNMNLIRIQEQVEDYEEWEKKLFEHSNINFASSLKQCCNLLNIRRSNESDKDLIMSLQFYKDFVYYLEEDLSKARNMLQYDEYIGEFYVHLCEWYDISYPARYERSVDGSVDNRHFSLNKKIYTHFTSPIRRFSDVIVHRLLKSVLNSNIDLDIRDEIDEVSAIGNIKTKCNKLFEKRCVPYAIFESTPCVKSFILDCVCSNITNEELYFLHPFLRKSSAIKSVKFSHLSLNSPPVKLHANESANFCELKWKKIIYSTDSLKSIKRIFVISNHLNDIKLSKDSWMLFREIRRSYLSSSKLEDKLKEIKKCFIKSEECEIINSNLLMDPIIEIKLKLYIKNTVKIQFCSYIVNGFKRVTPELMIIHPSFQLCLIHQEDPVMCFVLGGKLQLEHNDIILQFESVEQYKAYFTPLLQLETLKEILSENSEFTSDVLISWIHATYNVTHTKETFGIIKVSDSIFRSRNVDFHEENDELAENLYNIIDKGLSSVSQDMLCLRSKRKDWDNYWIGHGSIVTVGKYQETNGSIVQVIVFILTHSDFDIFKDDHNDLVFTVEKYSLSISARRQLTVVAAIDEDDFLQKVILGLDIVSLEKDESILTQIWEELKRVKISNLNQKQKQAISNAMFKKLSLIWGPPGTGKTSIGCIIAYSYCLINKGRGHVIYCGPSNDSVNVVVDAMTKFFKNDCPNMLRVFSKKQELADFPLPGQVTRYKPLPENLHSTSLHHLIRAMNNELSKNLKELDQKFKSLRNSSSIYHPKESVYDLIQKYKKLVEQAKKEYIKSNSFNLVLCTCSVSANSIMKYFKIKQVIIDEAGMCKEPETLLPIRSATKTLQNVVLIGDHKQLRPIILDDLASQRGLQISFFERYQLIKPELVTMLDQQYRMHPSICEFPSKYFYSNRLFTKASSKWSGLNHYDFQKEHCFNKWNGLDYSLAKSNYKIKLRDSGYSAIPDNKWPGQRSIPYISFKSKFNDFYPERLVFIHVVGEETVQSIATSTCGENSRANLLEVEAVGYIYDKLLKSLGNPLKAVKNITVLTQYRLQEDLLLSKCKEKINNIEYEPVVKTVIKSQGSENDYVIFSTVRSLRNKNDIIENPSPGWENKYLGFITDHNQVNVALTRARKGLIIIGNKNLLSVNKIWKSLLKDLEDRNCILQDYKAFI